MGLTSGAFLVLIIGIAVAGIAATVWLWPRAAGRRIWHIGVRIGMVAVSEALVIVAFLVMLNGYFSFYASWSQLLGSGTTQLTGTARAASAGRPAGHRGQGRATAAAGQADAHGPVAPGSRGRPEGH